MLFLFGFWIFFIACGFLGLGYLFMND